METSSLENETKRKEKRQKKFDKYLANKLEKTPELIKMSTIVYLDATPNGEPVDFNVDLPAGAIYKDLRHENNRIFLKTFNEQKAHEIGMTLGKQFIEKNPNILFTVHTQQQTSIIFISTVAFPLRDYVKAKKEQKKIKRFKDIVDRLHPEIKVSSIYLRKETSLSNQWCIDVPYGLSTETKNHDIFYLLTPIIQLSKLSYQLKTKDTKPVFICDRERVVSEIEIMKQIVKNSKKKPPPGFFTKL